LDEFAINRPVIYVNISSKLLIYKLKFLLCVNFSDNYLRNAPKTPRYVTGTSPEPFPSTGARTDNKKMENGKHAMGYLERNCDRRRPGATKKGSAIKSPTL